MDREELLATLNDIDRGLSMREDREKLADFILDNFTPKGEAEKVTAARLYEIMIGSSNWDDCEFDFVAKQAHEAAEAFNNYKPE